MVCSIEMKMTFVTAVLVHLFYVRTHACPDAVCQPKWTPQNYPSPKIESGLCGRYCNPSMVCDPCRILGNESGENVSSAEAPRGAGVYIFRSQLYLAKMGKNTVEFLFPAAHIETPFQASVSVPGVGESNTRSVKVY